MQRSKQQALMFLLGALLVGGVLGFSAERVFGHTDHTSWPDRGRMYDDLALTDLQRSAMDSVLDENNRQRDTIMRAVRPQLDSLKLATRQQFYRIFTSAQKDKFLSRVREDSIRREQNRLAREQKKK